MFEVFYLCWDNFAFTFQTSLNMLRIIAYWVLKLSQSAFKSVRVSFLTQNAFTRVSISRLKVYMPLFATQNDFDGWEQKCSVLLHTDILRDSLNLHWCFWKASQESSVCFSQRIIRIWNCEHLLGKSQFSLRNMLWNCTGALQRSTW